MPWGSHVVFFGPQNFEFISSSKAVVPSSNCHSNEDLWREARKSTRICSTAFKPKPRGIKMGWTGATEWRLLERAAKGAGSSLRITSMRPYENFCRLARWTKLCKLLNRHANLIFRTKTLIRNVSAVWVRSFSN